jgi:hypothetical protein
MSRTLRSAPLQDVRDALPPEVVVDWTVLAGTPFVENPSGEIVAFDPATGTETEVDHDLLDAAATLLADGQVFIDDSSGTAPLEAHDGRLKLVCLPNCAAPR